LKKVLGAEVKLIAGSNGIFEVVAGELEIFSKSKEKRFPELVDIVDRLRAAAPVEGS